MDTIDLICFNCIHFHSNNKDGLMNACRAFPDGIPDSILESNNHNRIIGGQKNDFVYTPIDTRKK